MSSADSIEVIDGDLSLVTVSGDGDQRQAALSDGRILRTTGRTVIVRRKSDDSLHRCDEVVDQHGRAYAFLIFPDRQFGPVPMGGVE